MRALWIEHRPDGVTEIGPCLGIPDRYERFLFIAQVMKVALGFFVAGSLPAPLLLALGLTCVAGDAFIALHAAVAARLRPLAPVTELAQARHRGLLKRL